MRSCVDWQLGDRSADREVGDRSAGDPGARDEALLILGTSASLALLLALVAAEQLLGGSPALAALAGAGSLLSLIAPLAFRRGATAPTAGHLLAGSLFATLGVIGFLTGARAVGLLLLHVAIPFAAIPGRRRACIQWGALAAIQVLLIAWFANTRSSFPITIETSFTFDSRFQSALLVIACTTILSLLYRGLYDAARSVRDDLAHSELRYRMVSEMTADYIYALVVRPDGTMDPVWATEGFAKITGYEGIELASHDSWMQVIHPLDHPLYRQRLERLSRGESDHREYRIITKAGEVRWLRTHSRVVDDGRRGWVYTAASDITEERAAKDALRESELRFRTIAEQSPVGIFIVQDERLVFANPALCEACGHPSEELLSWGPGEYRKRLVAGRPNATPDDDTRDGAGLDAPGAVGGLRELSGRHPDGHDRWWAVGTRRAPYGGRSAILGVLVDVTERKREEERNRRLEARVLEAQKLDSLGVLAGGMAHDFNNLLAAILGNAELLRQALGAGSPLTDSVDEITSATQQASDICRQMLIYAGRAAKKTEPTLLEELVSECLELAKPTLSRKLTFGVRLELHPAEVRADRTQLRQLILSLLTNADEAIGDSPGAIRVTTRKRWVSRFELEEIAPGLGHREGPYVELSVEDTGPGIDAQTQRRVFDPFFSTKEPGRGLGLAAARGIVRGHGGVLRVASMPGSGSRFEILLPALGDDERRTVLTDGEIRAPQVGAPSAEARDELVLLVDDDPLVRSVVKRQLERLGYRVLAMSDGRRAIEAVRDRGAELLAVILDFAMPHLDGAETLARVRSLREDLPALMVSGYDQSEIRERVGEVGLVEFLDKPFTSEQLGEKLSLLLEQAALAE